VLYSHQSPGKEKQDRSRRMSRQDVKIVCSSLITRRSRRSAPAAGSFFGSRHQHNTSTASQPAARSKTPKLPWEAHSIAFLLALSVAAPSRPAGRPVSFPLSLLCAHERLWQESRPKERNRTCMRPARLPFMFGLLELISTSWPNGQLGP
jgi:hypothetical protein